MLRFSKVSQEEQVDGHFTADDPRVIVKPDEMPRPLYPEDEGFWSEFRGVIEHVMQAKFRTLYRGGTAECFEKHGITHAHKAADAVHKDWPTDWMLVAAKYAGGEFREFLPGVFTDKTVLLNKLMAHAAWAVSASSFCAKKFWEVPRPEEVAGAIARGEIDCPDSIMMLLRDHPDFDQLADDQRKFTMYPEGSPNHGSYNAMHSAAASAAGAIIKTMKRLDALASDGLNLAVYNIGYFRRTAGVHYGQDNLAGFWLGQEVANRIILHELVSLGADEGLVRDAISDAQTDWLAA